MREVNEKFHTIDEISPRDGDPAFTAVFIGGEEVLKVNQDSSWEVERVLTDFAFRRKNHEVLVVVFKRKEEAT